MKEGVTMLIDGNSHSLREGFGNFSNRIMRGLCCRKMPSWHFDINRSVVLFLMERPRREKNRVSGPANCRSLFKRSLFLAATPDDQDAIWQSHSPRASPSCLL